MNWLVFLASICAIIGIFGIITVALDLQFSYGNMVNFGIVGYVAAGAYGYAILTQPPAQPFDSYRIGLGLPSLFGLLGAICAGLLLAGITAWPVLRLRGDYLAIMTLAFAEVLNILLINEEWLTNGLLGFSGIGRWFQGGVAPDAQVFAFAGTILAILAAVVLMARRLVSSPYGKLLLAASDDELGTAAIGKDVARLRLQIFLLGGALMGGSGALYAMYLTLVTPETLPVEISFVVWIALVLGGVRRRFGPLVGVAVLFGFQEAIRFINLSSGEADLVASLRLVLVGLLLVVMLRLRPPVTVAGGGHPGRAARRRRQERAEARLP